MIAGVSDHSLIHQSSVLEAGQNRTDAAVHQSNEAVIFSPQIYVIGPGKSKTRLANRLLDVRFVILPFAKESITQWNGLRIRRRRHSRKVRFGKMMFVVERPVVRGMRFDK